MPTNRIQYAELAWWRSGNAGVCKTSMRGFDSPPGLKMELIDNYKYFIHSILFIGPGLLFVIMGTKVFITKDVWIKGRHNIGKIAQVWGLFFIISGLILSTLLFLIRINYSYKREVNLERLFVPPSEVIVLPK